MLPCLKRTQNRGVNTTGDPIMTDTAIAQATSNDDDDRGAAPDHASLPPLIPAHVVAAFDALDEPGPDNDEGYWNDVDDGEKWLSFSYYPGLGFIIDIHGGGCDQGHGSAQLIALRTILDY